MLMNNPEQIKKFSELIKQKIKQGGKIEITFPFNGSGYGWDEKVGSDEEREKSNL